MAFIFLFFLFPNFIKAEIINSDSFSEINKLEDFTYEDFEILNYESHPGISAPISV